MKPHSNGNGSPLVKMIMEVLAETDRRNLQQFQSQTDALVAADKRYEQRFSDQKEAVATAAIAQKEAVAAALIAQKEAVAAALAAQKENVIKAELAADKRFETFSVSVTEKIDALTSSRDTSSATGKGMEKMWGWVVAAVMLALAVFSTFWGRIK